MYNIHYNIYNAWRFDFRSPANRGNDADYASECRSSYGSVKGERRSITPDCNTPTGYNNNNI